MRQRKRSKLINARETQPHEQTLHAIERESYITIDTARYTGDLPSEEPNDWFIQSDELDYDEYEPDDYLWDEW